MTKTRISFLVFILLMLANDSFGYKISPASATGFNIKIGGEYNKHREFETTYGLAYDIVRVHSRSYNPIRGIGLNFTTNFDNIDLGLQFKFNPLPRLSLTPITKSFSLYYFGSVAYNYRKDSYGNEGGYFTPGVGIYFAFTSFKPIRIIPEINIGYVINDTEFEERNSVVINCKLSFLLAKKKPIIHWERVPTLNKDVK